MSTGLIVFLVVLCLAIGAIVALYFFGRKMQKKQEEQQAQVEQYKQSVSMLIIDKKRMKLKESGLPAQVIEQTPWYLRRSKVPVVKAKVGPQIMVLICDDKIFDMVPVRKEVRATVSGIYITAVKGLHGTQLAQNNTKKSWYRKMVEKLQDKAGAKPLK